jgi:hypothetical protein
MEGLLSRLAVLVEGEFSMFFPYLARSAFCPWFLEVRQVGISKKLICWWKIDI